MGSTESIVPDCLVRYRSLRSSIFPRLMRLTSSKSSTSRTTGRPDAPSSADADPNGFVLRIGTPAGFQPHEFARALRHRGREGCRSSWASTQEMLLRRPLLCNDLYVRLRSVNHAPRRILPAVFGRVVECARVVGKHISLPSGEPGVSS